MLDRVSTGQEDAEALFERLYLEHHRAVLGYCARRTSKADAWDATAEVFLVAWRRLADVPMGEEARPWLLGVAYRVLANQRRASQRRVRLYERMWRSASDAMARPEDQLVRSEDALEVLDAVAKLGLRDREILLLSVWEDLSPKEIASVLGISRAAVDQRYARAKRRLERRLDRGTMVPKRATRAKSEEGGAA